MAKLQNPVIVVPGMMGTTLHDAYPLQTLDLWTMILNRDQHRISLHPDNPKYEAFEPARVYAGRLFAIYNDLIEALRHELTLRADEPTPVFPFPYDWRRDVRETAKELERFVEEVIDRTKLLRHYDGFANNPKVDLVGHSMGGLLICEYLHEFGRRRRIGRVATMGTPYRGSIEAVVKLATGLGSLAGEKPSERERETARSSPATYQLLPSYRGAVLNQAGRNVSIFNPQNWQESVVESLVEYVRQHSATDYQTEKKRRNKAVGILRSMLAKANSHRRRVARLDLESAGLAANDWLAIVGLGEKTRLRVGIGEHHGGPRFDFRETKYVNQWAQNRTSQETGDGTVALAGALPPFLPTESPVCVRRGFFERFEIGDRFLLGRVGLHAVLPNMNLIQRLVIRHLRPKFAGKLRALPVPGVKHQDWNPPIPRADLKG